MEVTFSILVTLGILFVVLFKAHTQSEEKLEEALGFDLKHLKNGLRQGVVDGMTLTIDAYALKIELPAGTMFQIRGQSRAFGDISSKPLLQSKPVIQASGEATLQTNDEAFDRKFCFFAHDPDLAYQLQLLKDQIAQFDKVRINESTFTASLPFSTSTTVLYHSSSASIIRSCIKLVSILSQPFDKRTFSAQQLQSSDPELIVSAMRMVRLQFPKDPMFTKIVKAKLNHANPEVRIHAGLYMGKEGYDVIRKILNEKGGVSIKCINAFLITDLELFRDLLHETLRNSTTGITTISRIIDYLSEDGPSMKVLLETAGKTNREYVPNSVLKAVLKVKPPGLQVDILDFLDTHWENKQAITSLEQAREFVDYINVGELKSAMFNLRRLQNHTDNSCSKLVEQVIIGIQNELGGEAGMLSLSEKTPKMGALSLQELAKQPTQK